MGSALHFSLGVCTRAFRADFHRPIYSRICYRGDSWDFQAVKMSRHCLLFFRDCRRQWGKSVSVQLTDEGRSPRSACRADLGLRPGQGPPEAGSRARPGRFGQRPTAEGGAPGRAGRGLALAWSFPQERYTMLYLLRKSAPSFGRPSALRKVIRSCPIIR